MRDSVVLTIAWLGAGAHAVVGALVWRAKGPFALIPLSNLATASCVLTYWGYRWYGYLFRGISWYAADQLLPLYAAAVVILAGLTLSGRYPAVVPHWFLFVVHALCLLGIALFLSLFRLDRLF